MRLVREFSGAQTPPRALCSEHVEVNFEFDGTFFAEQLPRNEEIL